ncbi:MAG TPA: D-alanyl-D-alanine carboxypeptidase, partial [Acidimicrobiales bacterium]|nr:D-alanyl-D-alanine carboxypeptidase [Acidimicrobiales bacterium]
MFSLRRLPGAVSRTVADARLAGGLDEATGEGVLGPARDHTCLAVRDPAGRTLYSHQADLSLIPASALKLVTGAVALAKIGGSTRFTTEVRGGPGPNGNGTVGDLWLVGGGDPLLSTVEFAVDGGYMGQARLATPMESLADRVVAAGVRTVQGRILGDDSRYDN